MAPGGEMTPYQQPASLIHLKEPGLKTDSFSNDQPVEAAEWLWRI